jgi:ribosomal protein L23
MTIHKVLRRPLVTEKGVDKKDNERTLCFEVASDANKTQVKAAVQKRLEEGVRQAQGRGESSRVRGDLVHADQDFSTHNPDPPLPYGGLAGGHQ